MIQSNSVGRDWGKWLEQEQAVSTGAVRRQLTRTLSKQSNLVQSHVSHLGKTQTVRMNAATLKIPKVKKFVALCLPNTSY